MRSMILTWHSRHQLQWSQHSECSQGGEVGSSSFTSCFVCWHQHRQEPGDYDNEVHDVPGVPQVGVRVKDEAHGHDLGAHLHSEDTHEVGLQLLQLQGQDGLVTIWKMSVHAHDHAVGDDGEDDAVLERTTVDQPLHQSSTIYLFEILAILKRSHKIIFNDLHYLLRGL